MKTALKKQKTRLHNKLKRKLILIKIIKNLLYIYYLIIFFGFLDLLSSSKVSTLLFFIQFLCISLSLSSLHYFYISISKLFVLSYL